MKKFDIFIAIIIAFAWGSNYVAVSYTVSEVPAFLSLSLRCLITAIVLLPFVDKPKVSFKDLYLAAIVFGVFYIGLVYLALTMGVNASLAVILMQLTSPFSIIIARIFLKEQFTLNAIIGIAIAFFGAIIVVGMPGSIGSRYGLVLLLLAAVFNAIFNVQSRQLKAVPALALLCWNSLIATPHLFLISYFLEGNPIDLMQNVTYVFWSSLFYTLVVASLVGITAWIYLLQKYPVYQVMPFTLLIPPIGVFFSIMLLGNVFSWHLFFGGCLTILGIAVTQSKSFVDKNTLKN